MILAITHILKIIPPYPVCVYNGQPYGDREKWISDDQCQECTCYGGQHQCRDLIQCRQTCEHGFTPEGQCCPDCTGKLGCCYIELVILDYFLLLEYERKTGSWWISVIIHVIFAHYTFLSIICMWLSTTKGTSGRSGLFWDTEQNGVQNKENQRKSRLCKGCVSKCITSIFRYWVSLESWLNPLFFRRRQDVPFVVLGHIFVTCDISIPIVLHYFAL